MSTTPSVSGQIISAPGIDYAYPSIAYLGNNEFDNRALITCSYSSLRIPFRGQLLFIVMRKEIFQM
ncbi:MAG: hypothetical protein IPH78_12910 [Bacteroidetes bacterium]|nr:hypothetical protein [Bacteroidota bacterium]